jgi:hypothetical protein
MDYWRQTRRRWLQLLDLKVLFTIFVLLLILLLDKFQLQDHVHPSVFRWIKFPLNNKKKLFKMCRWECAGENVPVSERVNYETRLGWTWSSTSIYQIKIDFGCLCTDRTNRIFYLFYLFFWKSSRIIGVRCGDGSFVVAFLEIEEVR